MLPLSGLASENYLLLILKTRWRINHYFITSFQFLVRSIPNQELFLVTHSPAATREGSFFKLFVNLIKTLLVSSFTNRGD